MRYESMKETDRIQGKEGQKQTGYEERGKMNTGYDERKDTKQSEGTNETKRHKIRGGKRQKRQQMREGDRKTFEKRQTGVRRQKDKKLATEKERGVRRGGQRTTDRYLAL